MNIKYTQECLTCGKTFRGRKVVCVIDTKTETIKRVDDKKTCRECENKLNLEWLRYKWTHPNI